MTGKSHCLFAGSLAFALGFSPAEILIITACATLPDRIEKIGYLKLLRGFSHDLALWLPLLLLSLFLKVKHIFPDLSFDASSAPLVGSYLYSLNLSLMKISPEAFVLGPLFHLLADMLTPAGIRFLGDRIAFPLCGTGKFSEYVTVAGLSLYWTILGLKLPSIPPVPVLLGKWGFLFYPEGLPARVIFSFIPLMVIITAGMRKNRETKENRPVEEVSRARETAENSSGPDIRVSGIYGNQVTLHPEILPDGTMAFSLYELRTLWTGRDTGELPEKETIAGPPEVKEKNAKDNNRQTEPEQTEGQEKNTASRGPGERLLALLQDYREDFVHSGLGQAIKNISELLLREGSKAPSVAAKDPPDSSRPRNQYDLLMNISLLEHSLNVAEKAIEIAKKELPDSWRAVVPRLILCSLAHDIGKLPSVSGNDYTTASHPLYSAGVLSKLLKGHPWQEDMAELVRRHHERPDQKTPTELKILIKADREAREEELEMLGRTILTEKKPLEKPSGYVQPEEVSGPPTTREIPEGFPLEKIFERIKPLVNRILENGSFVAFSQPDGVVYVQAETVHAAISEVAREHGYDDEFFHSTEKPVKKSCLQSFYNEFRRRGWVPEKLVSERFYGNFFWVWNPRKQGFTRTFYMPFRAQAFGTEIREMEELRKKHPVLATLSVRGVAPPGSEPPEIRKN